MFNALMHTPTAARTVDEAHPDPGRDQRRPRQHHEVQRAPVRRRGDEPELRPRVADEHWMHCRAHTEQQRSNEQRDRERPREPDHYILLRMTEVSD